MARIRSIKPDFFRHHELYTLEQDTHLPLRVAFAGLWTAADKAGRFKWRPPALKLDCLPFDVVDFDAVLDALVRGQFICHYTVDGEEFGCVRNWDKHQRPRNDEDDSRIPPCPNPSDVVTEPSLHSDELVTTQSRGREGKGREGKGMEEEPRSRSALVFPVDGKPNLWSLSSQQIEHWQTEYPTLNVREQCERALKWLERNPTKKKKSSGMHRFLGNWFDRELHGYPSKNGNGTAITSAERKRAEDIRRRLGGCTHNPRCASYAACITTMVHLWRDEGK